MAGHDVLGAFPTCHESLTEPGHHPYVRHRRVGWSQDRHGDLVPGDVDESHWEVVCVQCGDDEGPPESQSESASGLRGPFTSEHRARHVADRHEAEWNALHKIPGIGLPSGNPPRRQAASG